MDGEKYALFLKFLPSLSQWINLVVDYEEKVRERLDVAAHEKFCGFDRYFEKVMNRLEA